MLNIYFFMPDIVGGVSTIILELIRNIEKSNNLQIIAYKSVSDNRESISFGLVDNIKLYKFQYLANDNLSYVGKKITQNLKRDNSIYVATDFVELYAFNVLKIDVPVVFIVMGDFKHYYDLAFKNEGIINRFICISKEIQKNLIRILPHREGDIFHNYYPTSSKLGLRKGYNLNKITFVARLEVGKNPLQLLEIDRELKEEGIVINWDIIGTGPLDEELKLGIEKVKAINFKFLGTLSLEDLYSIFYENSMIISTSISEGLPVSIVDAMKTGLVPIVSNINGGISEIVKHKINGFVCNCTKEYVDNIKILIQDRNLYDEMSMQAVRFANENFDPLKNSIKYLEIIQTTPFKRNTKFINLKGNFLDKPFFPNYLVRFLRTLKNG
jgi:glycosyltransferase involved in cell wall biosynthesis